MLIVIPILIIAAIVGVYHGGDFFKSLDLSIPQMGENGVDVRQFLGSPGGSAPNSNSPLEQLSN